MKRKEVFIAILINISLLIQAQTFEDNDFAAFLDSLTNIQFSPNAFLKPNIKSTPKSILVDSIPDFDENTYRNRLAKLDAQTPFDLLYHEDVRQFIRLYLIRKRGSVSRMLGISQLYYPIFEEVFDRYNLPLELKHLAVIESALIPFAKSRAGAMGLWQFMYPTGKLCGLKINSYTDERCDPYKSTVAAAEYLKQLYDIFKDWQMVLAAYNAGPGTISRAIRRSGGKKTYWEIRPYLPRETQYYVPAFIAANYVMNYAAEHNVYPEIPNKNYFEVDTVIVKYPMSFQQISEILDVTTDEIRYFNPQYRKNMIPEGGYSLCLPKEKIRIFVSNEQEIYAKINAQNQFNGNIAVKEIRKVHVVKKGEKLNTIAKLYGVSVSDIKNWNFIGKKGVRPGKKLVIYLPDVEAENKFITENLTSYKDTSDNIDSKSNKAQTKEPEVPYHIVKKGENMTSIARKYGISVLELKKANHSITNSLKVGQKIIIPRS
jgi:membrane-bound lytic murein transglycosylase D